MTTGSVRLFTGFTLLELLMAVTIVCVLVGAVAPIMNVIARNQAASTVNALVADLALARSFAITEGDRTVLCKSGGTTDCSKDAPWHQGWIVFVDGNNNRHIEADERILHAQTAWDGGELFLGAFNGTNRYIVYAPDGSSFTNASFTYCPAYGDAARKVVLSPTGRARAQAVSLASVKKVCHGSH